MAMYITANQLRVIAEQIIEERGNAPIEVGTTLLELMTLTPTPLYNSIEPVPETIEMKHFIEWKNANGIPLS